MAELAMISEDKKFMWDGKEYTTIEEADEAASSYSNKGFELLRTSLEGIHLVYTRRLASE